MRNFQHTGNLSDLTEGMEMLQQAVALTPHGHPNLPARLNTFGITLQWRFERIGEPSDLADAISAYQKAVDLTPENHPDLPSRLSNLGNSLTCRFERTGELSDIDDGISVHRKAVDLTPESHPDLPGLFTNLGGSLVYRFKRTGEPSDISDAICVHRKAVDFTSESHPDLPALLNNLGGSLRCRYDHTGALSDIVDTISIHQKAVDLTPENHPHLPSRLSNLGNSLTCRFERTGELSDIVGAISMHQKAVDLTPERHPDLPGLLNNLGGSLTCRFEHTGELSDIADAISVWQGAVGLTPESHPDLPSQLSNLGCSLTYWFERTGELSGIAYAISVLQKAVDLTHESHPELPSRLSNLANSLASRSERTGELSDITDSISMHQKAIDLTPESHPDLSIRITNLGNSLALRSELTSELLDIADAIAAHQKAVALTPENHPDLCVELSNLGSSLYILFNVSSDSRHLEESVSQYRAAATCASGPPQAKLSAAIKWARRLSQHLPQSPDIIASFDSALALVALIAGLEQTVRGRHNQLEGTSGLALEAAAAACVLDRPDKALEWLEQGRCLVWRQLSHLRTPLDNLRIQNEDLAQDIANVSKQLDTAGLRRVQAHDHMQWSQKITVEREARTRLDLAKKWDDLLGKARALPGFESFLMPLPCSTLTQHLPDSGPIVILNVDERRCDALALLAGLEGPLHIPLPAFTIKKASEYRDVFGSQLRARNLRFREGKVLEDGDGPVHRVLGHMWEEVVKPVLDALGFAVNRASEKTPPRIWWCPIGPLSFLPLHAAGVYRGAKRESVFDYVVSSYTPTVTAITDRVKNHRSVDDRTSGLFLTCQPNVTGAPSIPGTTSEVRSIYERAEGSGVRALKLEGGELTVSECIKHMQEFSSVHLACHASQDAAEPLQSRFLFHDGSLELGTILQSNLKNADLAFLSACQTSTGEEKLADEAVHLAAGMLAAGYRSVVGTMWSIGDKPAQEVATAFYDYLFTHQDGSSDGAFDGSLSAIALHYATQELRRSLDNSDPEKSLLTWIPFVHFGL
ncbi:CHAT domain-containing protein [Ephemerocybe angulata]|uniref:CHAT domain-containing protein n=1 Tax=Ephemerocybe angulata TaxID=980116 RepID=A0A8H6M418_9AGAR|nr:CHAT domain-containing protein [Tulosesus angulatus]